MSRRQTQRQIQGQLALVDPTAWAAIVNDDPRGRNLSIADIRLLLQAFGVIIKINDMDKRVEIKGLPPEYSGEDAHNILATLLYDTAGQLGFEYPFISFVHEFLNVISNENRYHPVIELLNAEPWDGIDRLPEVYRLMGI